MLWGSQVSQARGVHCRPWDFYTIYEYLELLADHDSTQLGKSVDHSRPSFKLLDCSRSSFGRHHTSRPNAVRLLITAGLQ